MDSKSIIKKIGKKILYSWYYLYMSVRLPIMYENAHRSGQLAYLSDKDFDAWMGAFQNLLKEHCRSNYGYKQRELLSAFPTANIETVRRTDPGDPRLPIVVLCVKNDRRRIEMLVNHYRELGVVHFAFIDNGSTDGTLEWMLEQPDIDIYKTQDKYASLVKEAWINRIISMYGFDRWYIQTDSDELIKYIGMEDHNILDVVGFAERKGLDRLEAMTFDTYSERGLFVHLEEGRYIEDEYCWIDTDSYEAQPKQVGCETIQWLTGGPRKRMMNVSTSLMKFPLVYFKRGTLSANAHFLYPYQEINESPCTLAIMHYKFLEEDREEFARRAKSDSGFAFGGKYYQNYLQVGQDQATFMYEGSRKYIDSNSLNNMPFLQKMEFNEK